MISELDNGSKELLEQERRAEHALLIDCIRDVAITVPLTVALWVGLIALAVGRKDPDWGAWLGMAAGIGVLAGLFFGVWIAFVRNADHLQKIDTRAVNGAQGPAAGRGRQGDRQRSRWAA
jgi:hypothetical protein